MAVAAVHLVLLACLCLSIGAQTSRRLSEVPEGKVHVYKYSAVIKAGQNEPSPYASKLQVEGKLIHKQSISEPDLPYVDYFRFYDVKHTVYNGPDVAEVRSDFQRLDDSIKDFEEPFLVVYDNNSIFQGFKIQEKEANWSKNMKKSLVSLMQFSFDKMGVMHYTSYENTIHGECLVDYIISRNKDLIHLRKHYEPRSCSNYVQHVVSDAKKMPCKAQNEEDLLTSSEKVYEFEIVRNSTAFIRKIVSTEKFTYLPYLHKSAGIQYIETRQTFELEQVMNESELSQATVDFKSVPLASDVKFDSHDIAPFQAHYFGRSVMSGSDAVERVASLLVRMVDYLRENQISVKEIHKEQKGLLLNLHHAIKSLDSKSMHAVYKLFNAVTDKENVIRRVFLEMVPHAGTYAAWNFTKNMILKNELPDESVAVDMLANLPMYVSNPSEEFVKSVVQFRNFQQVLTSPKIAHAGVLCYSILLNKVYQNVSDYMPEYLKKEIEHFTERIHHEPTYESKIVYIMAMRNVEVGKIHTYLAPIIDGSGVFYEKNGMNHSEKYRRAAMWAVSNAPYTAYLLQEKIWKIFANSSEPLSLRLTAYEILVPRNPLLNINLLMKVYWIMTEERDEHLFNYHYTTMKYMAQSTDPCMKEFSNLARKVLRFTQRRKVLSSALSAVNVHDYFDRKFGYGKTFKIATAVNENSGLPQIGYYELSSTFVQSRLDTGIHWNTDGVNLNMILSLVKNLAQGSSSELVPYEIVDDEIRNLLKQTQGYKLRSKDVHVEFWTINKGYVTDVEVLSQKGLSEYIKKHVLSHKPRHVMDIKDKFDKLWLDVSFHNQYEMVVATDIGLPVVFSNEAPYLSYIKLKPSIAPYQIYISMKLEFEAIAYYHGRYQMQFYNPFADLMQSVRRDVTANVVLPIDLTVTLNLESYVWKLLLPRLPETRFSVAGIKTYTVDEVAISNDVNDVLKTYCSTCKHQVEITRGPSYKNNDVNTVHSKEIGLEFSFNIYDCENYRTSTMEYDEFSRILEIESKIYEEPWPATLMKIHHGFFNFIHAPYANTCGKLIKISPSTIHPIAQIEMYGRFEMSNVNSRRNIAVEGAIHTIPTSANETGTHWDVNFDVHTSPFINDIKLQATKRAFEEKKYKICLAARKIYPNFTMDLMSEKQETNTKITLDMGYTDSQKCSFDDTSTSISIAIKGELLDEQIKQIHNNVRLGSCFKNPSNSLDLDVTQRFDWNCMYEAIKGTTMRKYTINVTYNNIPKDMLTNLIVLDDYLRYDSRSHLTYISNHTEPGNIKIVFSYSMNNNYANVTVMNPIYTYEIVDLKYGSEDSENRGTDLTLDNIGFNTNFLVDYYKGEIRPCIAHVNDVITDLNQTIPMEFKDWTLLSGDHELMTYAVFVKTIQDKLAVKIYTSMHVLEIQPGIEKPYVFFDGIIIENYENGVVLPILLDTKSYFKLIMVKQLLMVETEKFAMVKVFYTPYNVIVLPHIILDRNVDGVCGHMGSTAYVQEVPLVYKD